MSLQIKQTLKLSQSLVMTPQLQLSLKLLAMNRLDLAQSLQTYLIENPALEEDVQADQIEKAAQNDVDETGQEYETFDRNEIDRPGIENHSKKTTLKDYLLWQVQMSDFNVIEREIAAHLLEELNEKGYLDSGFIQENRDESGIEAEVSPSSPLKPNTLERLKALCAPQKSASEHWHPLIEYVAHSLDVFPEWVDSVRRRIMLLDPLGCLALDLRECLLVQLRAMGFDEKSPEYLLVDQFLPDLESRNFRSIMRQLKLEPNELSIAIKVIESLEPYPARAFTHSYENVSYVVPDIYVMKMQTDYAIVLNEDDLPKLKLNPFYVDRMKGRKKSDDFQFINEKVRSAMGLIRSLHQRRKTIIRVMETIIQFQRDWFDDHAPLKPLILKTVADEIGVHESTVSRVTNGKYVHTPKGTFELKYFFSSAVHTLEGHTIANEAVKDAVKKLIATEDPKHPFSDLDLVQKLREQDIQIARRTIAKYRETLGIPPSNRRKSAQVI